MSICDVRDGIGFSGTWGADGQILFSSIEGDAIWSVPAGGGAPSAMLKPDAARGEARLNWPFFLPDGRRLLYLQRRRDGSGRLMLLEPGAGCEGRHAARNRARSTSSPATSCLRPKARSWGSASMLSRAAVAGAPFSIADSVGYFLHDDRRAIRRVADRHAGVHVAQRRTASRLVRTRRPRRGHARRARSISAGPLLGGWPAVGVQPCCAAGAMDLWQTDLERQIETRPDARVRARKTRARGCPTGARCSSTRTRGGPPQIFRKNLTTGERNRCWRRAGRYRSRRMCRRMGARCCSRNGRRADSTSGRSRSMARARRPPSPSRHSTKPARAFHRTAASMSFQSERVGPIRGLYRAVSSDRRAGPRLDGEGGPAGAVESGTAARCCYLSADGQHDDGAGTHDPRARASARPCRSSRTQASVARVRRVVDRTPACHRPRDATRRSSR